MADVQRLYKVDFTINDSYSPKIEGINSVSLCVMATSQFTALSIAWDRLSALGLDEPKSFSASRVERC